MAPLVPLSSRRDLKPPAFLHLDPAQRFPRVSVRGAGEDGASLFGPFRDRRAAEKAQGRAAPPLPPAPLRLRVRARPRAAPGHGLPLRAGALVRRALPRPRERGGLPLARGRGPPRGSPVPRRARRRPPPCPRPWPRWRGARAVIVDAGRSAAVLYPVRQGRVLDAGGGERPARRRRRGGLPARLARAGRPRGLALARHLAAQPEGPRLVRPRGRRRRGARRRGPRGAARPLRRPHAGW